MENIQFEEISCALLLLWTKSFGIFEIYCVATSNSRVVKLHRQKPDSYMFESQIKTV